MSAHNPCTCEGTREERMKNWGITMYCCNYSAFNGYRHTDSDYSAIRCLGAGCLGMWRTKANYVDDLPMIEWTEDGWAKEGI